MNQIEEKTYKNANQLATALGIDVTIIKAADKMGIAGFEGSGRVNWAVLKPEFEKRFDEIVEASQKNLNYWKTENARKDSILKDLEIKKKESEMIEPDEVRALIVELATKQSVVLKRVFGELPPKLTGKSEPDIKTILDNALKEIFGVLQDKAENWK